MNASAIETAPPAEGVRPPAKRTNRGALDSLTIRLRTTGEKAAARAVAMRRLRVMLPVAALLLIVAFFFNTRTNVADDAFLDDFADMNATSQNMSSVKPQFSGVDNNGNPYEITADSASQKAEDRDIVELNQPRAVTAGADTKSVVAATAGVFNTDDKKLLLKDGVTFEREIGRDQYVLKSQTATVSIDDQTVVTGSSVAGEGPDGSTLKADRMQANNRDGGVVFEGGVSMRIYPKDKTGAAADKPAADKPAANQAATDNPAPPQGPPNLKDGDMND